jgi:hypothetical protein
MDQFDQWIIAAGQPAKFRQDRRCCSQGYSAFGRPCAL